MGEEDSISRSCATTLAACFAKHAEPTGFEADGAVLRLGAHRLHLRAEVEIEGTTPSDQHLLGLAVSIDLDDEPQPLRAGVVGVGDSRQGALDGAVEDWCDYVGIAVVRATVNDPAWATLIDAEENRLFAGGMLIRAALTDPWPEEFQGQLIEHFRPIWRQLPGRPEVLHSLEIHYASQDGSGFVRVEGHEFDELTPALASVPWPHPGCEFMVKQFLVVRGA